MRTVVELELMRKGVSMAEVNLLELDLDWGSTWGKRCR